MADAASFLIALEEKISGPAKAGAQSLAQLDAQIKKDSAALKTLESAMKRLEASGGGTADQMASLRGAIDAKKASIAGATDKVAAYKEEAAGAGEATGMFSEQIAAMGGPVGIAVAAVTVLVAGLAMAVGALASMALAAAGAQRNQLILAQAMTGSAAEAKAIVDATYRVSSGVALAGDKVQEYGASLMKAGLSGKAYETSLKNLANVASVAGEQAVGPIKEIIEKSKQLGHLKMEGDQLKGTGLQASEVFAQLSKDLGIGIDKVEAQLKAGKITADQGITAMNTVMERKFGKLAASKLLGFDEQIAKAKENVGVLFKDVKIEPFLQALSKVTGLLDQNTTTGRVLKGVLTESMSAFFGAAAAALPYVKQFLIGLAIAGLKIYIAMKPAIEQLKALLGVEDTGSKEGLDAMAEAGKVVGGIIAAVVGAGLFVLATAGAAIYSTWQLVSAPFYAAGAAISFISSAVTGAFAAAQSYLENASWGQIATDLIAGFVAGISGGTGMVVQAIAAMGGAAMSALKAQLGIASPSKVFAAYGGFTAEGFAGGIDKKQSAIAKSVEGMVQLPQIAALKATPANDVGGPGRAGSGGAAPPSISVGELVVHINGSGLDEAAMQRAIRAGVHDALADLAAQRGAPSADEPQEEAA